MQTITVITFVREALRSMLKCDSIVTAATLPISCMHNSTVTISLSDGLREYKSMIAFELAHKQSMQTKFMVLNPRSDNHDDIYKQELPTLRLEAI